MNRNLLKKSGTTFLSVVLLTGMMTTPASASQVRLYEINTLEQLKDDLKNYSQESCVNIEDQMELIEKSSPEVIEAFIEEKTEEALLVQQEETELLPD